MRKMKTKSLVSLALVALMVLPLVFAVWPQSASAALNNGPINTGMYQGGGTGSSGTSGGTSSSGSSGSGSSGSGSSGGSSSTPAPTPAPTAPPVEYWYYDFNASAGTGGSISPSGYASVREGRSKTYTITPNAGYKIANVTVNGASQGAVASVTAYADNDKTVVATFTPITYTITASAGTGGTISPSGAVSVNHGASKTFAITPNTGYELVDVLYNGVSQGKVTSFTASSVTANGTLNAVFKLKDTTDLSVTSITPLYARVGLSMLSMVTYYNTSENAVSTTLSFTAGGSTLSKDITVPAKASGSTVFTWLPSGTGTVSVSANINPAKAVVEIDYTNNSRSAYVTVRPIVDPADPDVTTPVNVIAPPSGENNNYVEWTGSDGKSYWARLTLTATPDKTSLKSGYGFGLTITPTLTTNCPDSSVIIQLQAVVMRVPESHYETGVLLNKSGSAWMLPVNPSSVKGSSVWFVPVWFPDVPYIGVVTAYGAFTPGGELTASVPVSIAINGSMYEDDSTNNAWGG